LAEPPYSLGTFTAGDGYAWQYRHFPAADGPPRGHVVCIHGIQSHGGWYEYSCERLGKAGFDVWFLDRRGAGLNVRDRGDAPSFRRLVDDIAEFMRWLRSNSPDLPVVLVCISWGGKLGAALQRRHPGLVDALALLCPGFVSQVRGTFGQTMRVLWDRVVAPRRLFPIPLSDPELFTATPRWQRFLREDSYSVHEATARFLVESVRLDIYLWFVPRLVHVPVLLLLAGRDRIIDNAAARRFVGRFATDDKGVIEYPDAHHTLEFEPDPDLHLTDLLRWLDRQVPQRG
jgi:alpha-beta hydrolase superfamily lysophospholipase